MGKRRDKHPHYIVHEIPSTGGDTMGDIFRDAKAYFKERRANNLEEAQKYLQKVADIIGAPVKQDLTNHTWQTRFLGSTLQYYPTRGKWQWKGQVYHGGILSFIGWLANRRQFEDAQS